MKRSDMVKIIKDFNNNWNQNPHLWFDCEYADGLLKEVEKHMKPRYSGKHQSSYDIAMGNPCEWDREEK